MLHIAIFTHGPYIPWTIASLLDKEDKFHLHLFTPPSLWEQLKPLHKWALTSFPRVNIYQTPFDKYDSTDGIEAKLLLQFRRHWENKPNDIDRVLFTTTRTTIFIQNTVDSGQVPTAKWMNDNNKVVAFGQKYMYINHPIYGDYYKMVKIDTTTQHDSQFFIINWKKFLEIPVSEFYLNEKWTRQLKDDFSGYHTNIDSSILSGSNTAMMEALVSRPHSVAPVYFSGVWDPLLRKEALGPKECLQNNILLRKCYALNYNPGLLVVPFHNLPTLSYMAMPFEPYERLIDKIPLNIRDAGLNEVIITKSQKQKKFLRKSVEARFLLNKTKIS